MLLSSLKPPVSKTQQQGYRATITANGVLSTALLALVLLETFLVTHYRGLYMQHRYGDGAGSSSLDRGHATQPQTQQTQVATPPSLLHLLTQESIRSRLDALERRSSAPADASNSSGGYLLSTKFAPLRITVCTHRMPTHFAPCLHPPGVDILYAEEVMYPAHKVRLPGFVNDDDRKRWLDVVHTRGLVEKEDGKHIGMHLSGQNFVFRNTRYEENPYPDNWCAAG